MAQVKKSRKSDNTQPHDEVGRFTQKDGSAKSPANYTNAPKANDGKAKSSNDSASASKSKQNDSKSAAASTNQSKESKGKPSGNSENQRSKER